jgi:hypothetical protein
MAKNLSELNMQRKFIGNLIPLVPGNSYPPIFAENNESKIFLFKTIGDINERVKIWFDKASRDFNANGIFEVVYSKNTNSVELVLYHGSSLDTPLESEQLITKILEKYKVT